MSLIDILLPTSNRLNSLIYTLSGVAAQSLGDVNLILADQSETPVCQDRVVQALLRIIQSRGGKTEYHYRVPSQGIAEQRHFLLQRSSAPQVLYLDDDVFMEPWVLQALHKTLAEEGCGFVGAFPAGLSYRDDHRPSQENIEFWQGPVEPEAISPDSPEWERWQLHRAANLFHVAQKLPPNTIRMYKVAWIASCILYDRQKLLDVGGFSFWDRLPRYHSGEEVLVQILLMRRWGGCGLVPSGTYYSELQSTVLNSDGKVDGHALDLLPEMVEKMEKARDCSGFMN
jgi:glycosyltransferase involved in cell wall biosynthesis